MARNGPKVDAVVWRIGAVTAMGGVLSALDITVVNVAVDPIARDLGVDIASVSWVVTGYLLAMAVVVPTSGWLARTVGLRRVYVWALAAFIVASLLCALAPTLGALVGARVLKGVAGALLAPVGQMIVVRIVPREVLGHVIAVLTVPVLVAPVIGPVVGGLLVDAYGWPSVFLINLPVGAVALVAAVRMLPRDEPLGGGRLDVLGLLLAGPGLALLLLGVSETALRDSLLHPRVVVPFVAGLVLLVWFVVHALRHQAPLLDLRLVRFPAYRAATAISLLASVVTPGAILLLPLYLQGPRGESTTMTAVITATTAIGVLLVLRWAGRTADRIGSGPVVLVGVLMLCAGTVPLMWLGADTSYYLVVPAMLVRGFGVAMLIGPVTAAAMRALPFEAVPDASVQLNVVQRLGAAVGTALFVVLVQRRLDLTGDAAAFGWTHRWVLLAAALVALPGLALLRTERRARRAEQAAQEAEAPAAPEDVALQPAPPRA